ncbi:adenylyl-sulfate kinase [Candidatus Woesearchaeota archaeon]|nr:MAG: adenylyl-sulfate kinase [Candidatus Woesearchaeota archaeon]
MKNEDFLRLVVVGHVDHGKSTLLGRLLSDTGSLPDGKLESVKAYCKSNSRPFEYAFLLDALKNEQAQGITIDAARIHFQTKKRDYLIIDAPGHIEFLKNMITGASRAESAILLIDAKEGVMENSKRHGYLLSMLGIKQILVCINKMDLVDHSEKRYEEVKQEYSNFLKEIGIKPKGFIPISAFEGDNIAEKSKKMDWYKGTTVLDFLDSFEKSKASFEKPFRMPLQDIYKFTDKGDDRRVFAGKIETGKINVGDEIVFLPSNKTSKIKTIESFNTPVMDSALSGESIGFTLEEQIYVKRGEVICKKTEKMCQSSSLIKANIFWMSHSPLTKDKTYYLKVGTDKVKMRLRSIERIIDATSLDSNNKEQVERHDVAECILELNDPLAFDLAKDIEELGRFVIVDEYLISGGGIITANMDKRASKIQKQLLLREEKWEKSSVTFEERSVRFAQKPCMVLITGEKEYDKKPLGKMVERELFDHGRNVYYVGMSNIVSGLNIDIKKNSSEHVRRLGEIANLMIKSGTLIIATASDLTYEDIQMLKMIVGEDEIKVIKISSENGASDLLLKPDMDMKENTIAILEYLRDERIIFLP